MKLIHPLRSSLRLFGLLTFLTVTSGVVPGAFAAEPDASAEAKTYALFVGADISIAQNKETHRVVNVAGDSFVIKINEYETKVPMKGALAKLQIVKSLKITEKNANISNFKSERSYTPENDPLKRQQDVAILAQSASQVASENARDLEYRRMRSAGESASTGRPDPYKGAPDVQPSSVESFANFESLASNISDSLSVDMEAFDAMDVSFEVSAEKILHHPYVVIVTRHNDPKDAQSNVSRNAVFIRSLHDIDRNTRKVSFKQGGFPPGFKLESCQIHLYDERDEIATTVSPKRVALTSNEAFQYLMIQHVGAHKGATLPPTPAMGKLPTDLPARLANGEFKRTYYVKVSESGETGETYLDEACQQRVEDSYLDSVMKKIRFIPALLKGRPVSGVAQLNLRQLSL